MEHACPRLRKYIYSEREVTAALRRDHEPVRPAYLEVARICLARGSIATPERKRFVERICDLYPEARVEDCLDRRPFSLRRAPLNV